MHQAREAWEEEAGEALAAIGDGVAAPVTQFLARRLLEPLLSGRAATGDLRGDRSGAAVKAREFTSAGVDGEERRGAWAQQ